MPAKKSAQRATNNPHVDDSPTRIDEPAGCVVPRIAIRHRFDLGHEPALNSRGTDAARSTVAASTSVGLERSVLTGITGAALIGARSISRSRASTTSAQPPDGPCLAPGARDHGRRTSNAARKADKLNRSEMVASAKQGFKAPVTIRAGDREVIKVRQFVRIATNLSMTSRHLRDRYPALQPAAPLRGGRRRPARRRAGARSRRRRRLGGQARPFRSSTSRPNRASLTDEDVRRIRGGAPRSGRSRSPAAVPMPAAAHALADPAPARRLPDALGYARMPITPFYNIEVRVVPENVTTCRSPSRAADQMFEERDVALKQNETLEAALRAYGATEPDRAASSTRPAARPKSAALVEGQRMRILVAPGLAPARRARSCGSILFGERGVEAIAATNDRSAFVSVTPPVEESQPADGAGQRRGRGGGRREAASGSTTVSTRRR